MVPRTTEESFRAKRISRAATFEVDAPPSMVFPLLCPVREREWIPGWEADIVFSESGLAENNCIFTTENRQLGPATYVVSRHESAEGVIEFVVFFPGKVVQKLDIALAPTPSGGTRLRWSRTYTGLSAQGNAALEPMTEALFQEQVSELARSLAEHCERLKKSSGRRP